MKKYFTLLLLFFIIVLTMGHSFAQERKNIIVSGVVSDASTDETMPGVTIKLGGNKPKPVGVTNPAGKYTVTVPEGSELIFTSLSFGEQKHILKLGQSILNIRLVTKTSDLSEVVVRGYQETSRELSTGNSTVIKGSDLQDVPVGNVAELLQGKVAGFNVQNNTGAPGAMGTLLLRGISNIDITNGTTDPSQSFLSATSPLFVIDGIPTDVDVNTANGFSSLGPGVSPLSLIPQEDIASIEVLKDAQATSLYGSRGAYGVILITTRRGASVKPRVRYTTNFFVNAVPKLRATIGGEAERQLKIQQIRKYGSLDDIYNKLPNSAYLSDSLNVYYNNSTDWQGIFYGTTYNSTHNLSIEGGTTDFNYKTNLGYYNSNGIIKNTGFDRYTLDMNMEYKPNSKFRVFAKMSGSLGKNNKGNGLTLLQTGVAKNASASSLLPPPSLYNTSSSVLSSFQVQDNNNTKNLVTSLDMSYKLLPGLTLGTTGSYSITTGDEDTFTPAEANITSLGPDSKIYAFNSSNYTLYNRNNLSFSKTIGKYHQFTLGVFNEMYVKGAQAYVSQQDYLPKDGYLGPIGFNGSFAVTKGGGLSGYSKERSVSFAGIFSYNFARKYVLDLSFREDASSFSGVEDPYSKNPAIGLRWNINNENLFKNSKWMDFSSLRVSWGRSIAPTGSIFDVNGTYKPNGTYNGIPRIGIDYSLLPNPALGAATSTTYNAGIEGGFFKGAFSFTFDTYYRNVSHQTQKLNLPNIVGFTQVLSSDVGIVNYGYELSVTVRPLPKTSKINLSITANGAINKDVLTHLPGGVNQIIQSDLSGNSSSYVVYHVGRNALSNYLFTTQGVYSTNANVPVDPVSGLRLRNANGTTLTAFQAGDPQFKDVNGDYIIDDNDREVLGNSQPIIVGGFGLNVGYKNFGFSLNGSFTLKRDILNSALAERLGYLGDPYGQNTILSLNGINYWQKPGDVAQYADPYNYTRSGLTPWRLNQSLFQSSGSYFKFNTATFNYSFNKQFVSRLGIGSLRMYFSMNNLFTISSYSGPNAEAVTNTGIDTSAGYPVPRTYNIGLNVEL